MTEKLWVLCPYHKEPRERILTTLRSACDAAGPNSVSSINGKYGLPEALNRGVRSAKKHGATHVCWLSTGDTLDMRRFDYALPTSRGQCCRVYVESRGEVFPDLDTDWQGRMYEDNTFCGSGMVVPVGVWEAVGGFDERLTYCSDWDFAVRVQHRAGWECVEGPVLATANEYEDGLTRGADVAHRTRDRATVAKMARRLRAWPTPLKNPR